MFYDNFVALCAANLKSPSAVGRELGIDKSTVSCWKRRKAKPSDVNAKKIADYFGVSVEDLMGLDGSTTDVKNERPADGEALTEKQKEAIEFIKRLSDDELGWFLAGAKTALNRKSNSDV
mgnify:CR=1 FL=1